MSFRVAETHGWQTDPRPVRGVSRNVHVSERVARGRNVRASERVECQTYKIESIGKRTRYYQAMIDADSLLKGAAYSELKESYIIFICLDDPFDKGLPAYTFERKCREDGSVDLGDKTHHVVFNAEAYKEEKDPGIRAFLSFVRNNTAESDLTRRIANMVQAKRFEQTFVNEYLAWNLHDYDVRQRGIKEGREEGIKEGREDGLKEGRKEQALETARILKRTGIDAALISQSTGLSPEDVEAL